MEALPAHEWRYVGHRARLLEIRAHHEQRFLEVLDAVRAGYDTAWEVAPRMDWSRPWDQIDGFMRRSAIGEAYAHLRALARRGVLEESEGEPARWKIVEA